MLNANPYQKKRSPPRIKKIETILECRLYPSMIIHEKEDNKKKWIPPATSWHDNVLIEDHLSANRMKRVSKKISDVLSEIKMWEWSLVRSLLKEKDRTDGVNLTISCRPHFHLRVISLPPAPLKIGQKSTRLVQWNGHPINKLEPVQKTEKTYAMNKWKKMVSSKPVIEIPHPIFVITSKPFELGECWAVCWTSKRIAKFVRWLHWQIMWSCVWLTVMQPWSDQ